MHAEYTRILHLLYVCARTDASPATYTLSRRRLGFTEGAAGRIRRSLDLIGGPSKPITYPGPGAQFLSEPHASYGVDLPALPAHEFATVFSDSGERGGTAGASGKLSAECKELEMLHAFGLLMSQVGG